MATAKKKSSKSKTAARPAARPAARLAAKKTAAPVKRANKKVAAKKSAAKTKTAVKKAPAKKTVAKTVGKTAKPVTGNKSPLLKIIEAALADMKAVNITVLDVRGLTDVADTMVIASGTSDRHVKSIAERVSYDAKHAGFRAMGVEGERDGEWALVDLNDVIVHVMLPRVREFYRLESLWDISAARREASV
ncbi:MAG: ribosome silencing factor [Steroidobacteraceae bacterium]